MEVIATKRGYLGKLREPGDKFDVPKGSTATWFVPVDAQKPAKAAAKSEAPKAADEDLV